MGWIDGDTHAYTWTDGALLLYCLVLYSIDANMLFPIPEQFILVAARGRLAFWGLAGSTSPRDSGVGLRQSNFDYKLDSIQIMLTSKL